MAEYLSSLDVIPRVRKALGNPATGDVPDADIVQFIWLAETELAEMYEFPSLREYEDVATVSGTTDYTMTEADILRFIDPGKNITTGNPVKRMDNDWDIRTGSRITGQSSVFWFYELGEDADGYKIVRFRPTPAGGETIRLWFIKLPTMYDDEVAMRSDLPISHQLQVIKHATKIGHLMLDDADEAGKVDTAETAYAAEHALPGAAFHKRKLDTFHARLNRTRRRRRRG
jgi:hypothetical protein